MIEFIDQLAQQSGIPFVSAFFLGLSTAIAPCTFAANVAAIGYIAKDAKNPFKALSSGIFFSIGRMLTYLFIGLFMISAGRVIGSFARDTQSYGNLIIGPLLIAIGIWFAGSFDLPISLGEGHVLSTAKRMYHRGYMGALLVGIIFGFAFCPYSGMLFFGLLIPLALSSSSGPVLPAIFGLGVNIPVLIFAGLLYFSATRARSFGRALAATWPYLSKVIGMVLVVTGCYYTGPYLGQYWGIQHGGILLFVCSLIVLATAYLVRARRDAASFKEPVRETPKRESVSYAKNKAAVATRKEQNHEQKKLPKSEDIDTVLHGLSTQLSEARAHDYFRLKREYDRIEQEIERRGMQGSYADALRACHDVLQNLLKEL
mgnify:CR=1 FL=1